MEEVMDELQSRFLVNLPPTEFQSTERLFFQIEQCYWFYEDFYADQFKHLQHLKLHEFAKLMFGHCPLLQPLAHQCESMFQDFKVYQSQVPVVGCILLNPQRTKLLLVRNWKGTSWSFPRGKVNQHESDVECARREVMEECGYDVGHTLSEKLFIEFVQNEQRMRMYIAVNVPEDYSFAPQTRKEISLIQWFAFDTLPKKTWCVLPFMPRLRRWINRDKSGRSRGQVDASMGAVATRVATTPTKGRAASAPRNRPMVITPAVEKKKSNAERSVSTPHARPVARKGRGHFGTEFETATSYDGVNDETFGSKTAGFSVEEMFSVNERITGQKFEYDGNPHDFGKPASRPPIAPKHGMKGQGPVQILSRGARLESSAPVDGNSASSSSASSEDPSRPPLFPVFKFDTMDIMACVN
ncbi:hypothetical protein PINS_up000015 [Pythium insidiosum]|nr:hypothetical protein PINS_up000015 [Pythium insidiosum]